MIKGEIKLRVRYSDTDQMGYVYYGRYASFYEVARVELFRNLGCKFDFSIMFDHSFSMK